MTDDTDRVNPPANRPWRDDALAFLTDVLHGPFHPDGYGAWALTLPPSELVDAAVWLAWLIIRQWYANDGDATIDLQKLIDRYRADQ